MTILLVALAELLALTWFVASTPRQPPSSPVTPAIASLVFLLFGAVAGAPTAMLLASWPRSLAITLALLLLALSLAMAKVLGVKVGSSTSFPATVLYAGSFYGGAFLLLYLLRRG